MSGQRLYTYPEMNTIAPNATGIGGMVNAARQAYCEARRRYPWAFNTIFPDSPIGQFYTALGDKICPNRPPDQPVPETPAWRAACPIRYRVFFLYKEPNNPNVPPSGITGSVITLGPVQGIISRQVGPVVRFDLQAAGGEDGLTFLFSTSSGPGARGASCVITSVQPLDSIPPGGCELIAPPRQYPEPTWPEPSDFIIPPAPIPPAGGPPPPGGFPVPRVFPPIIPVPVPVPVPVPIAPVFFIPVRIGPIDFNFDFGGVNLQLNGTVNINIGGPQNTLPPGPGDGGRPPIYLPPPDSVDCEPCDVSGVIELISATRQQLQTSIDNQTDILRPRAGSIVWTQPVGPFTSGMFALPPDAAFVRFEFVDNPSNLKAQWGGGGAPDVTFAGWAFFGGLATEGGERIPLDFNYGRIPVPPWATHVGFTAKNGRSASVSVGRVLVPGPPGSFRSGRELLWRVE